MFKIFYFPKFKRDVKKFLSKSELLELESFIENQLILNGDKVGDYLVYPFLREKRIGGKRIYYLVYVEILFILLVSVSNKKNQQEIIDKIIILLPEYKKYVYDLYLKSKEKN